jgi:hypothetical protein
MWQPVAIEGLLKILTFTKKRDLERHCRETTIHRTDLALFFDSCVTGHMPFRYRRYARDYVPPDLVPSDKEREALADSGVDRITGDALKMARKIAQLFQDRRHLIGHFLDAPGRRDWHLFYFDQRDLKADANHWTEGAHIHLINWLLRPQADAEALWADFTSANVQLGGSLHIRFADDRPANP